MTHVFVLPHIARMTNANHHTQPLVEMGSCKLFAQVDLEMKSFQYLSLE
jgi:hypothetical protein